MNPTVLSVLLTLLEKRKVTRIFLAEKYELSPRTISRYIDTLLESGVPIISSTGHRGGYMLPDDYKIESMYFSDPEKDRITQTLASTSENYRDGMNANIIQKLAALGKSTTKSDSVVLGSGLIIDAGPWGAPKRYATKLDVINTSISKKNTLLIKYIDKNVTYSERYIDPYNLVLKQGVWYVYGYCHSREDFRLFKVSRINRIIVCDKIFSMRPDADAYKKLTSDYSSAFDEIEIEIEFSSLVLSDIEDWLGIDSISDTHLQYRARATLYDGPELLSKIMSFGSSVKVISPASLKEKVINECKLILN